MRQFLEDVRGKIGTVETFEKTIKIHINSVPFVPVKQHILDGLRKNGEYNRYLEAIKNIIKKEVDRIVVERKTKVNIDEICSSSQVDIDW